MILFAAIMITIPIALVELYGWRPMAVIWAALFAGSGILKLLGLGF